MVYLPAGEQVRMKYIVLACRRAGCAAVKKEKACMIFLKNIETLILNLTAILLI
jgi:hypothetical protein